MPEPNITGIKLLLTMELLPSDYDTAEADYLVAQAAYDSSVSSTNDTIIYAPISVQS